MNLSPNGHLGLLMELNKEAIRLMWLSGLSKQTKIWACKYLKIMKSKH